MNEPKYGNVKLLLGPIRLPFLLLTPACIIVGLGTAVNTVPEINYAHFFLILIGAISAHVSVNTFNEYDDFKSGLDLHTNRTLFSGGSGTLPAKPALASYVLSIAIISLLCTVLIGAYFVAVTGWELLPLGVVGLLLVIFYTTFLTRHPLACLIAPGLAFGPLMVLGTHYILTGAYSWMALTASLIPFFLVNNLLLLNQFPDIEADQQVGRKHFPITIGKQTSSKIHSLFLLLSYAVLFTGVVVGVLPVGSLLGLLALVIVMPTAIGVIRFAQDQSKLMPYMALNVAICLIVPSLIGVGMLF